MAGAKKYNRWIFSTLSPYIGSRILEIGCGIGAMTSLFINRGPVVGLDVNDSNLAKIRRRFSKKPNFSAYNHDLSKGTGPLEMQGFDTVLCVNVLEHIKDDVALLRNSGKLLAKGGRLVLFLPAFSSLYGSVDKADGHYRRYDRKSVSAKLAKSGFVAQKMFYMNLPGFFGWYYHNRILKTALHPKKDIFLFNLLVPVFAFMERIVHPPFGLSLIVVAKKKTVKGD